MSDKMRAEFEGYIKGRGHAIDWSSERGVYVDYVVQVAWLTWQASRSALVIELPQGSEPGDFTHPAMVIEINEVVSSIESAGVRVKP